MKIHVIAPITTPGLSTPDDFTPYARTDTEVGHSNLDTGPASIESYFDEVLAMPDTVRKVAEAEAAGAAAAVIDCMGDPGLSAAREATSMLVLGPAQTSMYVAALLAHNFSIVITSEAVRPMVHNLAKQYGIADKLCSIRSVEIPVLELGDADRLRQGLLDASLKAIEEDGAHAIVFGCTGMRGWAAHLGEQLASHGHPGIPVIDPVVTTFKIAEALVDLGLTPSARTYPTPEKKAVIGYDELTSAVRL